MPKRKYADTNRILIVRARARTCVNHFLVIYIPVVPDSAVVHLWILHFGSSYQDGFSVSAADLLCFPIAFEVSLIFGETGWIFASWHCLLIMPKSKRVVVHHQLRCLRITFEVDFHDIRLYLLLLHENRPQQ